ncbi:MAG: peroxide stress protein YaaA [Rhodoferax sp.]
MLLVLSPAKALDFDTPAPAQLPHTLPAFTEDAALLIERLRREPPQGVARLMDLSDKLAALNVARYAQWSPQATAANAKQAILAFDGDVYDGLSAKTLTLDDLAWLQDHVRILSGLYGVLRPLDWMQAYRLEMGTALDTPRGQNLYQFWGTRIAEYLQQDLSQQGGTPVLINLASQEYFKSVDTRALGARVIECVFQDYKAGQYKIISFFAKRARGLMARFAAQQHIDQPEGLQTFDAEGYRFCPEVSDSDRWVFRRRVES